MYNFAIEKKNLKIRIIIYYNKNKYILSIIYKFLILFLFLMLPLAHSQLGGMFWIDLDIVVNGNYEFTKVTVFNIFSSLICILFLWERIWKKKSINIALPVYLAVWVIIISTLFSISPITSLFWWTSKWHGMIFFINLIWLFIVLSNHGHHFHKQCIKAVLMSSFLVAFLGIWQYAFPSFDYWELSNRAISTLGHPNYLAAYLLMIIPLLYKKLAHRFSHLYLWFTLLMVTCLLLTKSALGITLFILYNLYFFQRNKKKTIISIWILWIIWILFLIFSDIAFPKLHSFLSRFSIWDTTLNIISSDLKSFIFGSGLETLRLTFDTAKSPYVYIYENFGFTADRPHNLILNIWYHTWIVWLWVFFYTLYYGWNHIKKTPYKESLILLFLFTVFNFPSVVHYSILALIIAIATHKKSTAYTIARRVFGLISFISICLVSILWWYFSYSFYQAEISYRNWDIQRASEIFPYHPTYFYSLWAFDTWLSLESYPSKQYYRARINQLDAVRDTCDVFTKQLPTAENYFYCADMLDRLWYKDEAKSFYMIWLERLPDLWNSESEYYEDVFIKKTINGNRFFSEKYSPIKKVLEKVWK